MVSVAPTHVRFFVSYDRESDRTLAKNLLDRLQLNLRVSKEFDYDIWDDTAILVGEHRPNAIAEALQKADFGLFLVSVAWLAKFEPGGSLSVFVTDDGKPVIPVVLKRVVQEYQQLHGLEVRQLFRLESARGVLKCYAECCLDAERDRFAQSLFQQIEQRLKRWRAAQNPSHSEPAPAKVSPLPSMLDGPIDPDAHAEALMHAWRSERRSTAKIIDARARVTSLRDTVDVASGNNPQDHSVIALEALQQWALDPHEAPYCAILGEYGIGKTTTLKQFTEALLKRRRNGEDMPLPIFIDLRIYSATIHKGDVPPLEQLLQELLDRVWETTHKQAFKAEDILRLVREDGAILIFDGLDKKLVHLDENQVRAFLRTLWNALPPFDARLDLAPKRSGRRPARSIVTATNRRRGRMIFSCRSHYFKTLRDQNAMLRGEYREGMRATDYRAWVLLPFNEDQIRGYLSAVLGPERVDDALTLFARVHNLRELAERPYLLALIADRIGELEGRHARGEVVRGVTLYKLLVDEWLKQDDGKHHWRPEDKLMLMEEIAAQMWQDGAREWPWRRVLAWLGTRLAQDEVLRTRYAINAPELLEEDFRTATFVLRPDDSPESFRFAYTSLQEYFLAHYLLQALVDNEPGKWKVPFPSPETLDFLGQLLTTSSTRERERALRILEDLLAPINHWRPTPHCATGWWPSIMSCQRPHHCASISTAPTCQG
jgi:NACHT domain/TIR domain